MIDKNALSNDLLENTSRRRDICLIQDVVEEANFSKSEISKMVKSGITVLKVFKKHLEKLKEILTTQGDNFKLISLYPGRGTADVIMIAYILAEKESINTLFPAEYTIVTNDKELASVSKIFGINCILKIPNN